MGLKGYLIAFGIKQVCELLMNINVIKLYNHLEFYLPSFS